MKNLLTFITLGLILYMTPVDSWNCFTRLEKHIVKDLKMEMVCGPPVEVVVSVPVPDGFQTVNPDIWKVKRCSVSHCQEANRACLPTEEEDVPVSAEVFDSYGKLYCATVYVKQHLGCGCQCEKRPEDCNKKQVLNMDKCTCECLEEEKKKCYRDDSSTMLNGKCECVCSNGSSSC